MGDTIGFSEANGSSGLYFGMAQGNFWVKEILNGQKGNKELWTREYIKAAKKRYQKWDVYKFIRKSYKDIVLAEKIMFNYLGSDRALNRWWKVMMALLQMKS